MKYFRGSSFCKRSFGAELFGAKLLGGDIVSWSGVLEDEPQEGCHCFESGVLRRGDHLKTFKDFNLEAKAGIWP